MPMAPPRYCPCGGVRRGEAPCEKCGRGRRSVTTSDPKYRTRQWKARAKEQIASEPLCRECGKQGRAIPAKVADHIKPWRTDEEFWEGELQSLCLTHHGRKSAGERR